MNIKQIRYFSAVVERGSLSLAAKELFITVQAVSKTIADLERELGRTLFLRNNKGMDPTPFAVSFYEKSLGVLASFEDLETFSSQYDTSNGVLDKLHLALNTPAFWGYEVVLKNGRTFFETYLNIETTMVLATGARGLEGLHTEEFDALITVGIFTHPDVECHAIGSVPAAVIMSDKHPLAAQKVVSLCDLEPYSVATPNWFDRFNDTIAARYRERNENLRFVDLELGEIVPHLKKNGVIFTTGISKMTQEQSATVMRMLTPEDGMAVPICVAYLKKRSAVVSASVNKILVEGMPFS